MMLRHGSISRSIHWKRTAAALFPVTHDAYHLKHLHDNRLAGQSLRWCSSSKSIDYSTERKLTTLELQHMSRKGIKLAMLTAYDYPSAKHAERAGFDIVLVGDSLGMVVLGYDTTQPVTMEDMLHHSKAARRGAPSRFIVTDLPFGSYEASPAEALANARRLVKEGGADAVKLEGGGSRVQTVQKLVDSGIAVMGHIGLQPQNIGVLGGFRAQGRTAVKAKSIIDDAVALQEAGAFAIVVECVPAVVAKAITESVRIPVIGIGSGPHTNGQVLVYHDLLGIMHHPHHQKHVPSFCKSYAKLGEPIDSALVQYKEEVKSGAFPDASYSPYRMSAAEEEKLKQLLLESKEQWDQVAEKVDKKLRDADEYAAIKLY